MAFLLALAVAATVLMAQPGQLASAARASPAAEAFWRAALPDSPMPDAILELLRHPETDVASGVDEANDNDPPPPMNFNYDDYRALPRSEATSAPSPVPDLVYDAGVVWNAASGDDSAAAPSSTLFFLEDAVRAGESLPFHSPDRAGATADGPPLKLYTVRSVRAVDGSRFVVCRRGAAKAAGPGAVYGCRATGPARAYILTLQAGGERTDNAAMSAAAVCRTDTSPQDPEHAALQLLGVKPGGVAAVCHAVPDAQVLPIVLPAKTVNNPSAN